MKKGILIITASILGLSLAVFSQNIQTGSKAFPFAQLNDPKLSIISIIKNPEGYARLPEDQLTQYQMWLSNLPLLPQGNRITDWKGKTIAPPDTISGIVDMKINSEYITDADIPVLLLMHYFRLQGYLDKLDIKLSKTLTVNYKDWLRGKFIDDKEKGLYFRNDGVTRKDSDEEFYAYIDFITKYMDVKALRLNVKHTDDRFLEPSHILIQFKDDDPDSIGHVAIALDIAYAEQKERKLLYAYGGNPAQSVIVPNAFRTSDAMWFTRDEIREYFKEYGMGYFYRWANK